MATEQNDRIILETMPFNYEIIFIQDGIENVGYRTINGKQVSNSNYHLITYDFKSNEGYIDKEKRINGDYTLKSDKNWRR